MNSAEMVSSLLERKVIIVQIFAKELVKTVAVCLNLIVSSSLTIYYRLAIHILCKTAFPLQSRSELGWVASLTQGLHIQTNNHFLSHSHLGAILELLVCRRELKHLGETNTDMENMKTPQRKV